MSKLEPQSNTKKRNFQTLNNIKFRTSMELIFTYFLWIETKSTSFVKCYGSDNCNGIESNFSNVKIPFFLIISNSFIFSLDEGNPLIFHYIEAHFRDEINKSLALSPPFQQSFFNDGDLELVIFQISIAGLIHLKLPA